MPEEDQRESSVDTNPKPAKKVFILDAGNKVSAKSSSSGGELPDIQDQDGGGRKEEDTMPQADPQPDPQPGTSGYSQATPNQEVTR